MNIQSVHSFRLLFPVLVLVLSACKQRSPVSAAQPIRPEPVVKTESSPLSSGIRMDSWNRQQDSCRRILMERLENKAVANSIFQELYIRQLVEVKRDSLQVVIPFDLHGLDCPAPDCYQTDLFFSVKISDPLDLPGQLSIYEHRHGCEIEETRKLFPFVKTEQTPGYALYYTPVGKKALLLYRSGDENTAYFFENLDWHNASEKDLIKIRESWDEDNPPPNYPMRSSKLGTHEYEVLSNSLHPR